MKELTYRIISGNSSKVLPELNNRGENGTYDLCITSPPYWNLIMYNSGEGDLSMMKTEAEFEVELTNIYKNISRLLNDDGTLVSQWEDLTVRRPDGYTGEYMLSSINAAAEKAGMVLYSRYIWKKFTKKPSVMYSTYDMAQSRLGRPNPNWSYAFVYKHKNTKMATKKSEITREEWNAWGADAVWDFSNPGVDIKGAEGVNAGNTPFAPEFVDRFLKLYSVPGDKIIEPFLGSGTTMMQCVENCRSCTGVELNKTFVPGLKERVGWGNQTLMYKMNYKYEDLSML